MRDIVSLYEAPYDPHEPVVCFDEKSVELREDARPAIRGRILRRDSEYIRLGTCNLFMMTEPKGGRHWARVTKTRKKLDFARCLKWLANRYPKAKRIHLVLDNLNTHNSSSVIAAFGEKKGLRLWNRFEVHYTPIHGSWLNQAELALSVTTRCCLGADHRTSQAAVRQAVTMFWQNRRRERWQIDWRFTKKAANRWIRIFQSQH